MNRNVGVQANDEVRHVVVQLAVYRRRNRTSVEGSLSRVVTRGWRNSAVE